MARKRKNKTSKGTEQQYLLRNADLGLIYSSKNDFLTGWFMASSYKAVGAAFSLNERKFDYLT